MTVWEPDYGGGGYGRESSVDTKSVRVGAGGRAGHRREHAQVAQRAREVELLLVVAQAAQQQRDADDAREHDHDHLHDHAVQESRLRIDRKGGNAGVSTTLPLPAQCEPPLGETIGIMMPIPYFGRSGQRGSRPRLENNRNGGLLRA